MANILEDLKLQRATLDAAIRAEEDKVRDEGLNTIREIVNRLSLTASDLSAIFPASRAPVRARVDTGEPRSGRNPTKGMKIPPKYTDPATGKSWSGRGLKPAWVQEIERNGRSIEEFRVRAQPAAGVGSAAT